MVKNRKTLICVIAMLLTASVLLGGCAGTAGNQETQNTTEETLNIMQKTNPADDDTLNILMIGNSGCYYFADELYGIATAAGIKIRVCNVYYSGCSLEMHWTWWKNGEAHYEFFTYDENGRQKVADCDLSYCLQQQNWDVISLQESSSKIRNGDSEHLQATYTYRSELLNYLKEQFPYAKHCWHQTWAYQVGHTRNGYLVTSLEQQNQDMQTLRSFATATCEEFGLQRINSGEAWQIVREGGYDNLCARLSVNNGEGDYYHDGDIGGGQYLNACVWFEVLTGQSCVGNTFRPDYAAYLDDAMFTTFQEAAHQAVENLKAQ